jgi:hypothetical protein
MPDNVILAEWIVGAALLALGCGLGWFTATRRRNRLVADRGSGNTST